MKKTTFLFLLVMGLTVIGSAQAGDMEPPGPPAPTMVTLQEIYNSLEECTRGGLCGVPKTGQTGCWNESGAPIACAGTGQDGDHQAGVSVGPRFADNGDGTVTDNLTGLIWLQDAACFELKSWTGALSAANTLEDGLCGLTDSSAAGDWRLPSVMELRSLIDYGGNAPALPSGHPFSHVQSYYPYWSSTSYATSPSNAWWVGFADGGGTFAAKYAAANVWPVRGGQ